MTKKLGSQIYKITLKMLFSLMVSIKIKNIMKVKKYTDWTESLRIFNENKRLYELAMSKEKREEINRFKKSGDIKSLLRESNFLIDKIKEECKKLFYDDIKYKNFR